MEVVTNATWLACPNLDEFINISNGSSSPLIFEPSDSSSPSVTSLDTESEGDKAVLWNCTSLSSMPFLEMDDWLENMPFDCVSSLSPCTMDCSYSLTSTGDTKLVPSSLVSSAFCTSEPVKRPKYDCANLDYSLTNEGFLQDPTSDAKLDVGCPSSRSAGWIVGSDCSQTLRSDSNFRVNSGENVSEQQNVPNTTQTYPDLSKIIVKKPILDKAMEKLGGGKKGAQKLWQLIRLWLARRNLPVNEGLVSLKHVQDPVNFSMPKQFDIHSTLQAMGEKGLEDRVFFPKMEGMPDLDKKHATQWTFQQGCGEAETSPLNSLSSCCISEKPVSMIQENGRIDRHASWPPISSQGTVDGANFASYGVESFSDDVSEDALVIDGSAHPQTRNGLNLNLVPFEPPSLMSTSVAPGLSRAAQSLNSRTIEEALNLTQYNRVHTEHCNRGGLVNLHLGIGSAFQSERFLETFTMGDSTNPELRTPAATSRAARKSRMTRQRLYMTNHYARLTVPSASSVSWSSLLSSGAYRNMSLESKTQSLGRSLFHDEKVRKSEQNLKLLLQKELKPSDVGNLGRIVLPKKEAESHLPYLTAREGVALPMEDMKTTQIWNFRYRYWPNNKSRMYLLENTGNFVKLHYLQEGDTMLLYRDCMSGKYVIGGKKIMRSDATEIASGKGTSANSPSRSYGGTKFKRSKRENSSRLTSNTGNKRSGKNEPLTNTTVTSSPLATPPLTPPSDHFDSQKDALLQVAIPNQFPEDNTFGGHDLPQLECFPSLENVDICIEDFLDLVEDSKSGLTTNRDQELAEIK